jgi:hypothetical protein
MASGHVNRTNRPNTWLHRPSLLREKVLANPEPSTHGPSRHFAAPRNLVSIGGIADIADLLVARLPVANDPGCVKTRMVMLGERK